MNKPLVAIVMGSDSDLPVVKGAAEILDQFGVSYELHIFSAHRSPRVTHAYAKTAAQRGIKVIIAAAGGAAHLAGVIASEFPFPVIGIPIHTPFFGGVDSLYSVVQMPPGVPVATVGINAAGNAALLAIQILSVSDKRLGNKIQGHKEKLELGVVSKDNELQRMGWNKYGK